MHDSTGAERKKGHLACSLNIRRCLIVTCGEVVDGTEVHDVIETVRQYAVVDTEARFGEIPDDRQHPVMGRNAIQRSRSHQHVDRCRWVAVEYLLDDSSAEESGSAGDEEGDAHSALLVTGAVGLVDEVRAMARLAGADHLSKQFMPEQSDGSSFLCSCR